MALVNNVVLRGLVQGLQVARVTRLVSYFFFLADDNLLFARVDIQWTLSLKRAINLYEAALGQMVNFSKVVFVLQSDCGAGLDC